MPSNAPWTMCVLDQFRLERDGEVVARFYDRKPDQVLAYIALHRGRPIPRVELATAVWPDKDPGLARGRLSENLHYLRRDLVAAGLPDDCLSGNRHVVEMMPEIDSDIRQFENAVAEAIVGASQEQRIELLEHALRVYGKGLLPGVGGVWVEQERDRLFVIHSTAARQLASSLADSGAFEATPEFAAHLHPEDLARQWVRSRALETSGPLPPAAPGVAEPWVPGKSLDALERRLAERAVATAEQAEPHLWGPERADWLARLDAEYSDIKIALRWAVAEKEHETALALASAVWPYWQLRGRVPEGRELSEAALKLVPDGTSAVYAGALHGSGVLALVDGDLDTAEEQLAAARDLWFARDDPARLARCLVSMSIIAYRRADYARARSLSGQAIEILKRHGNPDLRIRALKDAALVEIADQQYDAAEDLLKEALALSRDLHNVAAEARILGNLSTVARHRDQYSVARRLSESAMIILNAEEDLAGVAFCLRNLGCTCTAVGDHDAALDYLDDSIRLSRLLGNDWAVGEAMLFKGRLLLSQDLTDEARSLFGESLSLFEAAGDADGVGEAESELAAIHRD